MDNAKIISERKIGDRFKDFVSKHPLWENPLIVASQKGLLSVEDYGYVISQHFYYSRNFSRLLSALMVSCESDLYRAEISHNLWEEAGEEDMENRHSNLIRKMLKNVFLVNEPDEVDFKDYTVNYLNDCLDFLKNGKCISAAAFLGWGTEGIVPDIYSAWYNGLLELGVPDEELLYLSLHIECDDGHAEIIENIALDQLNDEENDSQECMRLIEEAINKALSLRDKYFASLYEDLQHRKLEPLFQNIKGALPYARLDNVERFTTELSSENGINLYSRSSDSQVNFNVTRFDVGCEVMDPRLLEIPVGAKNENHRHAHESVFYILSGKGRVHIGDKHVDVSAGQLVYVPRWVNHHSENTGEVTLQVFAITDYGLTGKFSGNSESSYRANPEGLGAEIAK
ncbi:iron-containing redox enzyme family protein [Pseudoalteromonas sp. OOF1S-7]|uniref:iron-containing redox enzyme family protein n=1 Tax=Pseudoalteromonas sp. OOF1S-7 TaxID=2917757 RepID=UPI001EF71710|nr:iron-containing redox enzyme family protein [Pseudoalteromonas sp. OOF1S-7]